VTIVAALNDPGRSRIGDPRRGSYAVSFITRDAKEAQALEKALAALDLLAMIEYKHEPDAGELIYVSVWDVGDQRRLFRMVEDQLSQGRRELFQQLVRARGPILPALLEKIKQAHEQGRSPAKIAEELNELGVLDGMKGKTWTTRRIEAALA
jgi:hypothetical protein